MIASNSRRSCVDAQLKSALAPGGGGRLLLRASQLQLRRFKTETDFGSCRATDGNPSHRRESRCVEPIPSIEETGVVAVVLLLSNVMNNEMAPQDVTVTREVAAGQTKAAASHEW